MVLIPGWGESLEEGMATHSSCLAWIESIGVSRVLDTSERLNNTSSVSVSILSFLTHLPLYMMSQVGLLQITDI